jgi:hypothetical protein
MPNVAASQALDFDAYPQALRRDGTGEWSAKRETAEPSTTRG